MLAEALVSTGRQTRQLVWRSCASLWLTRLGAAALRSKETRQHAKTTVTVCRARTQLVWISRLMHVFRPLTLTTVAS
jgi:hypothetical protein